MWQSYYALSLRVSRRRVWQSPTQLLLIKFNHKLSNWKEIATSACSLLATTALKTCAFSEYTPRKHGILGVRSEKYKISDNFMNAPTYNIYHMQHAINLAKRGRYTARPNPCVGCVLVDPKTDEVLAEGWHQYAGEDHAEKVALKNLSQNITKNTNKNISNLDCYVTLEPCSHHGRTPPCVDALIKAKVGRVFIACVDPNPLVAGSGIKALQDAGIKVEVGILQDQAQDLNKGFMYAMNNKMPYVRCKVATSLDGKVALKNSKSKWITGDIARSHAQRLRASSGAVITGIGTLLADDSSMNVRQDEWDNKLDLEIGLDLDFEIEKYKINQPIRVVIDPRLEIDLDCKWLEATGEKWIIIKHDLLDNSDVKLKDKLKNKLDRLNKLENVFVKNLILEDKNLKNLLSELYKAQVYDVLVEAGPSLTGSFLEGGFVNELWHYQAPCIIGDKGMDFARMGEIDAMEDVLRGRVLQQEVLGVDSLRVISLG